MMMMTRQSLPFVEIISNSCNNILLLLLPCNYVSFILHLFTSTSRLFVNKGLIFVIAGTRKNARRKAAATIGDHLDLPEGPLTHRRRGAAVGGAVDEQGEEAPRTSLGDEEAGVASRPDAPIGGDDDDDRQFLFLVGLGPRGRGDTRGDAFLRFEQGLLARILVPPFSAARAFPPPGDSTLR